MPGPSSAQAVPSMQLTTSTSPSKPRRRECRGFPLSMSSGTQLLRQIDDIFGHHIKIAGFCLVRYPGRAAAELMRAVDETRAQAAIAGRLQVRNVGGTHHHLL